MMERDRLANAALSLCYLASAAVIVAVYREPLAALTREICAWSGDAFRPRLVNVRKLSGKLWRDVGEAIDDAG